MKKSLISFVLLLSGVLFATAQDFKLYYANNVTDVNDFNNITEDDSGLNWRLVGDTDVDGNQAEVFQVQQMLASTDMKGLEQQQQFWTMRDHTLLCFRVEDDDPQLSDVYEVVVEEPVSGQKHSLTVTNFFFVNVPLLRAPRTEFTITVSRVADPTQRIRFKYNVYDWDNADVYIFQLDRKRQLTGKTYSMQYITGYMDEDGYLQTDTVALQLKAKSFQSFYVPDGHDLFDVILEGDENKLRINKNRLHSGIDLENRFTTLRVTSDFVLDRHQDREFINFNWLGSGLFEKYDTLFLSLWNQRSQPVTSATIHVEQVDDKENPTHSTQVRYLGYDRNSGYHKVLTMGKPAYIEILAKGYYPTVYKYAGAADEETGFVSEDRCSADLTLRSGRWNDEDMVVSSHRFLNLHDERQVVVRNKVSHRLCTIEEMELTGRTAVDTITYIEDGGHSFPKLLDNKTIDRFAQMEITFSRPKDGQSPSSRLTCTVMGSEQVREAKEEETIVVSANDFTSFSRDYYFVRYNLLNAILKGEVARLTLTAGDLSLDEFPLLCSSDFNREQAQDMANEFAETNATGAPPSSSSSARDLHMKTSRWWNHPSLVQRRGEDPWAGDSSMADDGASAFADAGLDISFPFTLKFNIRPVQIYTGITIDVFKQMLALKTTLSILNSDDGGSDKDELREELRKEEESEYYKVNDKVALGAGGEDHDLNRWVYDDLDDIFDINSNLIGGGLYGGGTITLQTPLKNWKKFQLTEASGNFGLGWAWKWDIFNSNAKLRALKDVLDKVEDYLGFSFEAGVEASLQLDLGIHSYDEDFTSSMNSSNMGAFFEAYLKVKGGVSLGVGMPERSYNKLKSVMNFDVGLRAGAKIGGGFKAEWPFSSKIDNCYGFNVMGMFAGEAYASLKLFCLHISGRAGFSIEGNKLFPNNNDHNPYHDDFPYWMNNANVRSFANAYRRLPAPEPSEFGRLLVNDLAMDANPHFLGSNTIVYNDFGQAADYNDDRVTTLNLDTNEKETISEPGLAASHHMRSKRGEYEVVVYEQVNKLFDNEAVTDDNALSTSMDAMGKSRILASLRKGDEPWKTTTITNDTDNDGFTDLSPVVTIQDNGHAACVFQRGKFSLAPSPSDNLESQDNPEAQADWEDLDNYNFTGQLMLSTYDGNEWSQPTLVFSADQGYDISKYDLLMRGDTVLVAALISKEGMERAVLRYASKTVGSSEVNYHDDALHADDFFMLRVGKNAVIAMTYERTDSIRDIFVKTLDMDGTNDGRMGSDLGLDFCNPSNVKIVCDRSAEKLYDFAVLWTEMNTTRRLEDGTSAIDSMRTVLNASRIHLTYAPQVTAPITLGAEIDSVLVMTDFDGFLDDDSITVVYTLTNPETGAGLIMRSGKVFTNSFDYEVDYTSTALTSSSELPVNVYIRNTGTSAIEQVVAIINGLTFVIPNSYVAPRRTQDFTVMYPIDDSFDGYIRSQVEVVYNNVFKSRVSRSRMARSNVRQRSADTYDRVSTGEVNCIVRGHSIKDGTNTFLLELTDHGSMRSDMGVCVGIYAHPNGTEPLSSECEVVVPASNFHQVADTRKAFVTVSINGISEPVKAFVNARLVEMADENVASSRRARFKVRGASKKLLWTGVTTFRRRGILGNASMVNLFPTDVPTDIRRPAIEEAHLGHLVTLDMQQDGVMLRGLKKGETVRIFQADGRTVFRKEATSSTLFVPLHQHSAYVLSTGEEVFKFQY